MTRYNYFYETATGDCDAFPGTPYSGGFNHEWMNYRGKGRDMLLGWQKFHYDEDGTTVVKLEHVQYGAAYLPEDLGPSERARSVYLPGDCEKGGGAEGSGAEGACDWHKILREHTTYEYSFDRLARTRYYYTTYDEYCEPADSLYTFEVHAYDELMGRRIATAHVPGGLEAMEGQKGDVVMYDYVGLSQQLLVVRNTPWRLIGKSWEYQGDDPILSSFTHGPTGISARTDEGGDTVMEYDVQYDVLPDLFGGTTGVMTEGNQTLIPGFQHFDAFGVRLADLANGAAEYRWRGQESSETAEYDAGTHPAGSGRYGVSLIYMQTRDYDSETGRFLTPDALYVSSLTTQGMNRYIYCNNDPVNYSDPTGNIAIAIGAVIIGALIILAMALLSGWSNWSLGGSFWSGFFASLIGGLVTAAIIAGGWPLGGAIFGGMAGGGLVVIFEGGSFFEVAAGACIGGVSGVIGMGLDIPEGAALDIAAGLAGTAGAWFASAFLALFEFIGSFF